MADDVVNTNTNEKTLPQNALQLIRNQLNKDKIKLWEPPYTSASGEKQSIPEDLIKSYSEKFGLEKHMTATALEELRSHAVEKIAARKKFAESGIATLKIKLGRYSSKDGRKELKIETNIDITVNDLKEIIRKEVDDDIIKEIQLISCGHILENERSLMSYNIKNSSVIMAICKTDSQVEESASFEQSTCLSTKIAEKKKVAEALAQRKGASKGKHERFYLEIRDQTGKEIELPDEERKSLSLAMTFHDLGKVMLKEKQYDEAILLLLESDSEFKKCRSEVLNVVDNYALLCLDVVWCYCKIGSLENLPDSEQRLRSCRESLEKSYGRNMERVRHNEGRSENEIKSYIRLHLLEGICAFYKGQYAISSMCIAKAEEEARCFEVEDMKLSQVISMGFTAVEAKRALIACEGDVTEAVDFITKRKHRQRDQKEKERSEREKWRLSRKLGKTVNGNWVNTESYETLCRMGFSKKMSRDSLKHTNNNIDQALELLQTNPELLDIPCESGRKRKHRKVSIPESSIQQVVSMGFDSAVARNALIQHNGDVQSCVDELLLYSGSSSEAFESKDYEDDNISENMDDHDSDDDSSFDEEEEEIDKEVAATMSGLGKANDDLHEADVEINEELKLIEEYRQFLTSARHF